tara:strand:- start:330 stop:512 length:183 start_codon:yes stop_codon:yes gene_type:complete
MVTTWQIILAIIIVGLSVIMPIYYSYQKKKNLKHDSEPSENTQIKDYLKRINNKTKEKNK